MRPLNIGAAAHFGRERVVTGRSLDQGSEARVGKTGARVLHHRMDDVAVAAFHQHVGDRFAERGSLRNRGQVLLAFARRIGQKFALAEPFGVA